MENWKMESWTKYFLSRIGKKITVEANLKISTDEFGFEERYFEPVDGLEYRFDNFYIKGYQYHDIYCIYIEFVNSSYIVFEDGKIRNCNEDIWYPYFCELYYSLDDLIRNQKAGEDFFQKYEKQIPWKEFTDPYTDEEVKKYMKNLGITLIARQTVTYTKYDIRENHITYKIYDGQECVCDTGKNVFIDGEWKTRLINYMEEEKRKKEEAWKAESSSKAQAKIDESYSRIKFLKRQNYQ